MKLKLKCLFLLLFLFSLALGSSAQDSTDSLLTDLEADAEPIELLPKKMMLTQRMLWGEKGLYRKIGIAPELTIENRAKELRIRRKMLKLHQGVGILTGIGMIAQGVLGASMYNYDFTNKPYEKYEKIRKAHEATATGINIAYATTALMSFTAPPKQIHRRGVNSSNVHRALSYVHLTGMITTNVLSNRLVKNPSLKNYHRAAAYTAFASYFAAIAVMKFEF